MNDAYEVKTGTDPLNDDSDGDSYSDNELARYVQEIVWNLEEEGNTLSDGADYFYTSIAWTYDYSGYNIKALNYNRPDSDQSAQSILRCSYKIRGRYRNGRLQ